MRTFLIGANGQLGSELRQAFSDDDPVSLNHADLALTDAAQVWEILRAYKLGLILNTAAYHRVDECENVPERALVVKGTVIVSKQSSFFLSAKSRRHNLHLAIASSRLDQIMGSSHPSPGT